jgi:hypothetical protein
MHPIQNRKFPIGSGASRRTRSRDILNYTFKNSSLDELKKMAKTCPELQGFIRDHLYERLEVIRGTRRGDAYDLSSIDSICDKHQVIDRVINERPNHVDAIINNEPSPPLTARRLFFDEIKEEKENKTP